MEYTTVIDYFKEHKLTNIKMVHIFDCGCRITDDSKEIIKQRAINMDEEYTEEYFMDKLNKMFLGWFIHENEYDIRNCELYIYEEHNKYCHKCANKKIYCDEQKRPVGFEHVIMYHGLNAFGCDDGSYESIIENFETIKEHPEYEICCSTSTIGDVGIIIQGTVTAASNADLHSCVDMKTCKRYYINSARNREHIIYDAKDLKPNKYGVNDEIVVKDTVRVAIWLTDIAADESIQAAFDLANKYNLEIVDVQQDF